MPDDRMEEPVLAPALGVPVQGQPRWRLVVALLLTGGILLLAFFNRAWLFEAIGLARSAQPVWLVLALATILCGFLISSQVFQVVLQTLGQRAGVLRLWAIAMVAIVTSQLVPAGSVGSYAFLLDSFRGSAGSDT